MMSVSSGECPLLAGSGHRPRSDRRCPASAAIGLTFAKPTPPGGAMYSNIRTLYNADPRTRFGG